jgi:hypothetical protein
MLGPKLGLFVGSSVGVALGASDGAHRQLEGATLGAALGIADGAQLSFSEHAVSTGWRGIITLSMALPKFILMVEHLLNEDRLQYYQYLNIRN